MRTFARSLVLPLVLPIVLSLAVLATSSVSFGAAMCSPAGGAPGPAQQPLPPGGAIGPGAAGSGGEAFVDALAGGQPPAAPVCRMAAGSGEPASLPVGDALRQAGNPVDIVTGNKYLRQIDVLLPDVDAPATEAGLPGPHAAAAAGLGAAALPTTAFAAADDEPLRLLFSRHYNSRSAFALSLGRGWSHGFDTRLARLERDGRVELQIIQGDGRRIVFGPLRGASSRGRVRTDARSAPQSVPPAGAAHAPHAVFGSGDAADGKVLALNSGDESLNGGTVTSNAAAETFSWHWPGGRRLGFDAGGRLISVTSTDLDALRLRYDDAGRLASIDDTSGRQLALEYEGPRMSALRLPDGLRIHYDYDDHGQLIRVRYPDGRQLRYHYDDARAFQLLTGVTDASGRRSRYEYDELQRVASTLALGRPDSEALRFVYRLPLREGALGSTEVASTAGRARYRWTDAMRRHLPRLVDAEGEACATCPPTGWRIERNADGIVSVGRQRLRHDRAGRIVERRIVDDRGRSVWHERLFYPDDADPFAPPSRIERSSVVRGRTMTIALRRRSDGRLDALTLDGFAPAAYGDAASAATPDPVFASLRFDYHTDGIARGKLAAIERLDTDGTSIRTSFHYDDRRRLIRIEHGGMLSHDIERDALGRVRAERLPDGVRRERDYDRHWRLAAASLAGGTIRIAYDALGRPLRVEWPSGERWSFELGGAGLLLSSSHGWRRFIGDSLADAVHVPAALPVALVYGSHGRVSVADVGGGRSERLHDDLGRLVFDYASGPGLRRYRFDALGRLRQIEHADGTIDRRGYDAADRLTRREQSLAGERIETRLRYQGARLVGIDHPAQQAAVRHDVHGRLVELVRVAAGREHRQRFLYDTHGRLAEQWLSDGSRLLHEYDANGRGRRFGWAAPGARMPTWIVAGADYRPGAVHPIELRYGNGIRLERVDDASGRPRELRWSHAARVRGRDTPLSFRRFDWHRSGLPVAVAHEHGEDRYGFDGFGRLIIRERHAAGVSSAAPGLVLNDPANAAPSGLRHVEYFAYVATGARFAARTRAGSDWKAAAGSRNAAGLPLRHGDWRLEYGPQQRIVGVRGADGRTIRYGYNALGERVSRDAGDRVAGFLYREQALEAETDAQGRLIRHYLRWNGLVVAIVDVDETGVRAPAIAWLHHDHLGTPVAATDAAGRLVWRADYDAYGAAVVAGPLRQPLRFAGQYFDAETGLHDNYQRSYDPSAGRYLEPDPLGLAAGFDPYGYADGNPMLAGDPLGLLLFAFDGTKNGSTPQGPYEQSNVWKFFEHYEDPNKWYMTGVGLDDPGSGIRTNLLDAINANTAAQRVDYMLDTLDRFLDERWRGQQVPLDVVGFSRGAAMARDFVNRVAARVQQSGYGSTGVCLDLRFLGLWDTVAKFGYNRYSPRRWQLAIPSAVRATFHAVALNERRSQFPVESALGGDAYVIERGFIGGHSDVGGGESDGDLSDVALVWMVEMARTMGLPMKALSPRLSTVEQALVHDRNDDGFGDRDYLRRDASGRIVSSMSQRHADVPGMKPADTHRFIIPIRPRQMDNSGTVSLVGTVDVKRYAEWLKTNYGITIGY
ncbi:MAG: DUF2235 domain-containing protein [Burkholderiaceae bacterium]